jgi:putative hydrolase of the HAD superfamily
MTGSASNDGKAIKAIIFDYGNVLCRLDRAAVNRAIAAHCPLSAEEVGDMLWNGDMEREAETGRIDSRAQFERVSATIGADPSWTYEAFALEYMTCLLPNPDGEAALVGVSKAGFRTFVLSNTSFLHSRAIFRNETLATIPELFALSFKLGFMKPDPRCWLWILERARLNADECIYVDDVEVYCAAAATLGLHAIRYDYAAENLLQKIEAAL